MIFRYAISNLLIFIVTLALQVTVLGNVNVYGSGYPMIYFMAILFMPVLQPAWLVLISAFLCGLTVDFFYDTGGLHAAATTFMAFARIFVINKMEPQAGYVKEDRPGLHRFGPQWLAIYLLLLVFLHHSVYFMVEEGSMLRWGYILLKIVVSTVLSTFLIALLNLFIFRR